MRYSIQCGRCDGSGRFDRGYCFECKGAGYTNKNMLPAKTGALKRNAVLVRFSNGSTNTAVLYTATKRLALSLVEREIGRRGWDAKASPLDPLFTS